MLFMPDYKVYRTFRIISLVILITLSFAGYANAQSSIAFSPSQVEVDENEEFTMDIIIESDMNVSGSEMELSYDPGLISIISINEGNFFKQSGESTIFSKGIIDNKQGVVTDIYCVIMGEDRMLEPGTFATLTINSGNISGVTNLEMNKVTITNSEGDSLPVTINNAEIIVGDVETVTDGQESKGSESPQTGQNSLIPLIFAMMCLFFVKRK